MSSSDIQPDLSDRLSQIPKNEPKPVVGYLVMFIGVAMVAYGITALWFGMRDVMDVGGYCAEGGPYVSRQECPDGAELLMFTGIPLGIIGLFVAMVGAAKSAKGAGALLLLGWPALFVSLGYNFIDYAINPPENIVIATNHVHSAGYIAGTSPDTNTSTRPIMPNASPLWSG